MKVVIQRVFASRVEVDHQIIGSIGRGLNLLVGLSNRDTTTEIDWMVRKCLGLRLFSTEEGDRFSHSVQDINGGILVVSQFTLYGDCRKGRRPSFDQAAIPANAEPLYNQFVEKLRQSGLQVETGQFGAEMKVLIENDGPVTLILEKEAH